MGVQESLLVVGPAGDSLSYPAAREALLVPEVDAVRVVSDSTSELLRGVPDALADVHRVGSTAPGERCTGPQLASAAWVPALHGNLWHGAPL